MKRASRLLLIMVLLAGGRLLAATDKPPLIPEATVANVAYGTDAKQTLDFWRADAAAPTPVVVFVHGGGLTAGDKAEARRDPTVKACLDAGVSVASINYRYLAPGVTVLDVLHDAARAVQLLRSKADEWRIDGTRVAAFGESAGGSLSLWLAFHGDLANPASSDPVSRQSTRLTCAGAKAPQCSFDPLRWEAEFGVEAVERLGGMYKSPAHFGFATREALHAPESAAVRAEGDFVGLITPDDPPVFIDVPGRGLKLETLGQLLHHPRHALLLHVRCRDLGVADVANIPAYAVAPNAQDPATLREFLFRHLAVKIPAEAGPAR